MVATGYDSVLSDCCDSVTGCVHEFGCDLDCDPDCDLGVVECHGLFPVDDLCLPENENGSIVWLAVTSLPKFRRRPWCVSSITLFAISNGQTKLLELVFAFDLLEFKPGLTILRKS